MTKNFIGRRGQGPRASIEPCYADGEEVIRNLKTNGMYKFTVKESRNPEFNALAFVFLKNVFKYQRQYSDKEIMRDALSIAAGHIVVIAVKGGNTFFKVGSWAFDEMDDLVFRPLIAKIIEAAITMFNIPRDMPWIPKIYLEDYV